MSEREAAGVQQQAGRRDEGCASAARVPHVHGFSDEDMAGLGELDANLVGPAGRQTGEAPGEGLTLVVRDLALEHLEASLLRGPSHGVAQGCAAQTIATITHKQRLEDAGGDDAVGDEDIDALDVTLLQVTLQSLHGARIIGEDQQTRGRLVDAMDELLAEGVRDVFAADAGVFVDDDDAFFVVDDASVREQKKRARRSGPVWGTAVHRANVTIRTSGPCFVP